MADSQGQGQPLQSYTEPWILLGSREMSPVSHPVSWPSQICIHRMGVGVTLTRAWGHCQGTRRQGYWPAPGPSLQALPKPASKRKSCCLFSFWGGQELSCWDQVDLSLDPSSSTQRLRPDPGNLPNSSVLVS